MALHNSLTGAELHEPKAIAAAVRGTVYVADGAGSGAMQFPMGSSFISVNTLADLPAPSGGKIILAGGTTYVFSSLITTSDYFELGEGTILTAFNALTNRITYTGTGACFTGTDVNCAIDNLRFTCATSDAFNMVETGGGGLKFCSVSATTILACLSVGTFDKLQGVLLSNILAASCTSGAVILGAVTLGLGITSCSFRSTSTSYIGLDLTGASLNILNISGSNFVGGAGSIGIKGDAASANINTGFIATVDHCSFSAVTTPLSGITIEDIRWDFEANSSLSDSIADALLSLTANATTTVIAGVDTPALVLGTWVVERLSHFSGTVAGRATYAGERDVVFPIDATVIADPASGTNKLIRIHLYVNGASVTSKAVLINSGDPTSVTLIWQEELSITDYVEIYVENKTDAVDVTITDAAIRIR